MSSSLILKINEGFYSLPIFETMGIRAIFTTRFLDMALLVKKDKKAEVLRNQAFKKMGVPLKTLVCPLQVHEAGIAVVREKDKGRGMYYRGDAMDATDALVTDIKKLKIGVRTADCLPVFIGDPYQRSIAIVHAGWRGINQKIIVRTIERMVKEFLVDPKDLYFAFGPALRSCCYEVGKEFLEIFPESIDEKSGKYYFDLILEARRQITGAGVPSTHILDSRICTSCANHEFFSYRREGLAAGRMLSFIEIM
jgi:YfiH family protein